jgi:hypothetical protein
VDLAVTNLKCVVTRGKNFSSPFHRHFSGLVSPDQFARHSRAQDRAVRAFRLIAANNGSRRLLKDARGALPRLQIRPEPFGAMNHF